MKCHDCHVFLHHFLTLSNHGVLRNEVHEALIELSSFLRELYSKIFECRHFTLGRKKKYSFDIV